MPFGFWVLGNDSHLNLCRPIREASQMPFGFWVLGNPLTLRPLPSLSRPVSNAFRLLGSGEPDYQTIVIDSADWASQMPFGFWVLGNKAQTEAERIRRWWVSNAFRLLGSGGLRNAIVHSTLGATLSQMPFGFWVLGDCRQRQSGRFHD